MVFFYNLSVIDDITKGGCKTISHCEDILKNKSTPVPDISKEDKLIAKLKQECGSIPKIKVLIEKGFAAFLKVL